MAIFFANGIARRYRIAYIMGIATEDDMNLYRVTYSNGFWGDEVARSNSDARAKGEEMARACGVTVVSVRKVRRS